LRGVGYVALERVSSRVSVIFGSSRPGSEVAKIVRLHSTRRRAEPRIDKKPPGGRRRLPGGRRRSWVAACAHLREGDVAAAGLLQSDPSGWREVRGTAG